MLRATLHGPQHEPAAQALAGGPQPHEPARAAARPGDHARAARRALVVGPRAADAPRPLPGRATGAAHRRSARAVRVARDRRQPRDGHRLPARRVAARLAPATGADRGLARAAGAHAAHDAARDERSGRTRRAMRTTASTGRAAPARASCRSRSSTSSRRPTCGSILDLQARAHTGEGDESTLEYGVRAAASIAARALGENRNVGMTASGARIGILPADRGPRQYQKIMQVLAAVMANGDVPLCAGARRRRRPAAPRHERGDHHAVARTRLGPAAERPARAAAWRR